MHRYLLNQIKFYSDGADIVAELDPSNSTKIQNAYEQGQQRWWTVLESALTVLQYEMYSTIVRLSNVNWKLRQHEQAQWNALDNLLKNTKYVCVARKSIFKVTRRSQSRCSRKMARNS